MAPYIVERYEKGQQVWIIVKSVGCSFPRKSVAGAEVWPELWISCDLLREGRRRELHASVLCLLYKFTYYRVHNFCAYWEAFFIYLFIFIYNTGDLMA